MNKAYRNYTIAVLYGVCILLLPTFFSLLYGQSTAQTAGQASGSSYEQGAFFFRVNKPEQAIPLLERSVSDGSAAPPVYNYLGSAYLQTGNVKKALEVFLKGASTSGTDKRSLYYNAGNAAFLLADYVKAEEYFSLSLAADASWAPPFLNRGNTNIRLGNYSNAVRDYERYLALDADSAQASEVRRMISALNDQLVFLEQEKLRKAEEAERIKLEEERLNAEKARRAEEDARRAEQLAAEEAERRRKILEEVSASLQAGSSTNVSAGTEGVLDYEYEEAELE